MDQKIILTAGISTLLGGAAGAAITYFSVKKKFKDQADRDIADVKERYKLIRKEEGGPVELYGGMPVEEAPRVTMEHIRKAQEFMAAQGYVQNDDAIEEEQEDVISNVFTVHGSAPEVLEERLVGYDRDLRQENHQPYLISQAEFLNDAKEFDKISMVYFEGDDTLSDESERPVDDINQYVGEEHLTMFGIWSEDQNVVYVRNDQISADIEITRDPRKFSVVIYGLDDPDSSNVGIRRMRDGD